MLAVRGSDQSLEIAIHSKALLRQPLASNKKRNFIVDTEPQDAVTPAIQVDFLAAGFPAVIGVATQAPDKPPLLVGVETRLSNRLGGNGIRSLTN
jgi:hypothetical protein